jgi:hypothetical protein
MDGDAAFSKLIESFGGAQQLKSALETELKQLEITTANKGTHYYDIFCMQYMY